MEITWLGHSWFSVVSGGERVDFDPLSASYRKRLGSGLPLDDSLKASIILISHGHGDHWDRETIALISGPKTVIVAPRNPARKIAGAMEIEAGQSAQVDGVTIRAVPAHNLHKMFHRRGKGVGYVVEIGGKTVYHAGDTDFIPEMSSLGSVDVACLPIGGRYTMNVHEAAQAARAIAPAIVIPMHNLQTAPSELGRLLADSPAIRVAVLGPGESLTID
jgi:L-ascorbate metabolism protein UlaG (beta-lactamase superfamily)